MDQNAQNFDHVDNGWPFASSRERDRKTDVMNANKIALKVITAGESLFWYADGQINKLCA